MLTKNLFLLIVPATLLMAEAPVSQLNFNALIQEFEQKEQKLKRQINLSGKQRMLTQKMSKLVIQIEHDIQKKESLDTLKKTAILYDTTLKGLKQGNQKLGLPRSTHTDILKQIKAIEEIWVPFKHYVDSVIAGADMQKSIAYITQHNEALLSLSDQLVSKYEAHNSSQDYLEKMRLHIINIAGKQRMLTQKMSKEKLLSLEDEKYTEPLAQSIVEFDTALRLLIEGNKEKQILPPTNMKIIAQLDEIKILWKTLKPLYQKEHLSKQALMRMVRENPKLLNKIDKMVKMSENVLEY